MNSNSVREGDAPPFFGNFVQPVPELAKFFNFIPPVEVGTNNKITCVEGILQRTIDKYSACVEVGKPIDENPACVEETATHIGIREAEDWFRPIDLAKECDIYISSRSGSHKEIPITYGYTQDPFKNRSQNFKPKVKENYPQYLEEKIKIALYAVIHLITQETILLWSPWKYRCVDARTVRLAVVACSQSQAVFARRRIKSKSRTETCELVKMREYRKNEREVTSEQKIELAMKLQLAILEKEIELQLAKNKALSLNPAAKVEDKQFETNIENMIKV
ncbi:hypothetical protein TNCV_3308141 [Trichonephila clavipes]|nr:hypothetical protein TNCV_3308141 [Trichonephila clavipes]